MAFDSYVSNTLIVFCCRSNYSEADSFYYLNFLNYSDPYVRTFYWDVCLLWLSKSRENLLLSDNLFYLYFVFYSPIFDSKSYEHFLSSWFSIVNLLISIISSDVLFLKYISSLLISSISFSKAQILDLSSLASVWEITSCLNLSNS
jgi:hypothetical protein